MKCILVNVDNILALFLYAILAGPAHAEEKKIVPQAVCSLAPEQVPKCQPYVDSTQVMVLYKFYETKLVGKDGCKVLTLYAIKPILYNYELSTGEQPQALVTRSNVAMTVDEVCVLHA